MIKPPKVERIVCVLWAIVSKDKDTPVTYLPVPIEQLPMDYYNDIRKQYDIQLHDIFFLTNAGRALNAVEALPIAVEAGQLIPGVRIYRERLTPENIIKYERLSYA